MTVVIRRTDNILVAEDDNNEGWDLPLPLTANTMAMEMITMKRAADDATRGGGVTTTTSSRVILNGQFGCGAGVMWARSGAERHGGHKGHASLKFEKLVVLLNMPAGHQH